METLEPKTLIDYETQTLAMPPDPGLWLGLEEPPFKVGEFVWGKFKGNQWWPGRVRDPLETEDSRPNERSNLVAYFGVKNSSWCNPSQLKSFVSNFAEFASSSSSKGFKAGLGLAVSEFSKCLEGQLSCHCVMKDERLDFGTISSNLSVREFLDLVKDVSLYLKVVNVLEIGILKSWVVSFEKSLGVGHCRKAVSELVDKIDLDVIATEDASEEDPLNSNSSTRRKKKTMVSRSSPTSLNFEVENDNVCGDVKDEEVGSARRERKKSKYLSPPYTHLSGEFARSLSAKVVRCSNVVLEKEEEEKINIALVQADGFDIGELVSEIVATAANPLHLKGSHLGKVVRGFFAEYRRSVFALGRSKDVGDKLEEGKKTEGKGGRKRKDVVNDEGGNLIVKSEDGKKTEMKRARKKMVKINGEGLTPIGKSEKATIAGGEGKSLIDKSEEGTKIEEEGKMPIDEGTKTEVEEKKSTDKSDEGKKTEVKRGRKRKVNLNCEWVTPINLSNQTLEHSVLKDEAASKGNALNEVVNGKTPVTLNFQTVTVSYDGSSGCKRRKKMAEASQNSENVNNVDIGSGNGGTIIDVPVNVGSKITSDSGERKPRQRKNNKNKTNPEDPAALLLTFSPGITVPSKDELISACGKYGPIIESETEFLPESSGAKVVFARSLDAEKAFNDKVAAMGPHIAGYRLRYLTGNLSSTKSLTPIPVPKPPLPYIRKSLERMISSIGGVGLKPETSASLVGEMQGLLTKVDKLLTGPAAGTSA